MAPSRGNKCMLQTIDPTEMIDALRRPSRTTLDTLYMRCLGSRVTGIEENHST